MHKLLACLIVVAASSFAAAAQQTSNISLTVEGASLFERTGFYAKLVRDRGLGVGLKINLIAKNESETEIIEMDLWSASCFYTEVNGILMQDCAPIQNLELEDGFGNDLEGGVMPMSDFVLYPGEQKRITVYGHQPVDGSFKLRFNELVLEGKVDG